MISRLPRLAVVIFVFFAACKDEHPRTSRSNLENLVYTSAAKKPAAWKSLPVRLHFHKDLPENLKKPAREAAALYEKEFGKKFFVFAGETDGPYSPDEPEINGIYWVKSDFTRFTEKSALARTVVSFTDEGRIVDADIVFNGQYYDWNRLKADPTTVFVHEFGHVLGLKHFFLSSESAMNYYPYVSGVVHRRFGDYEKTILGIQYLDRNPRLKPYWRDYFAQDYAKALKALESENAQDSQSLYAKGQLLKRLKNWEQAAAAFKSALDKNPADIMAKYHLADSLWSANKNEPALRLFQEIVEQNPNHYESLANLGFMHLSKGNKSEAKRSLRKVLEIQPNHWVACQGLLNITGNDKYAKCARP